MFATLQPAALPFQPMLHHCCEATAVMHAGQTRKSQLNKIDIDNNDHEKEEMRGCEVGLEVKRVACNVNFERLDVLESLEDFDFTIGGE